MKKVFVCVILLCLFLVGCGEKAEESVCEHVWNAATHFEARSCELCGETRGEPIEHVWIDATCERAKYCRDCGYEEGVPLEHMWVEATCTQPQTCTVCGATEGEKAGHDYVLDDGTFAYESTCWSPLSCARCEKIFDEQKPHYLGTDIYEYFCTVCEEYCGTKEDVLNIINITHLNVDQDSAGGLDVYITVQNMSERFSIKYIRYNLSFYNAVQDIIYCDITRRDNVTLEMIGPIAPGEKSDSDEYWEACFYNDTYGDYLYINWIEIEYTNNHTGYPIVYRLEGATASYAVERWRS